jgi:heptosyltransferase-2
MSPKIEIFPSEDARKKIGKIWDTHLLNKKVVVIAPGSKWVTKRWPVDYYNSLIEKLTARPISIVLVGDEQDRKLAIKPVETVLNLMGRTTLLELAELLRRSDLLISNDSAPIHIASAFDIYILAIFGPTTRDLGFFPYSRNSTVIEHHDLSCRPCGLHGGNRCPKKHFRCMLEITPQRVYEEAISQLDI